ncbi:MAG: hypothetical protein MJ085_03060 [Clostridia bacterium]|nr:hypothetical protein [Clostridia bacterium]
MKKTLSQVLQIITHVFGCFFLQACFLSMILWFYTLTWKIYALSIAATMAISALDFFICRMLRYPIPRFYHVADLLLQLPAIFCAGILIMQMFRHKSIETLPLVITVLLLSFLIDFERILLVKKTDAKKGKERIKTASVQIDQ